ncbi:MAG: hypothetical protein WD250_17075 [Egibacteraceae bacterium]
MSAGAHITDLWMPHLVPPLTAGADVCPICHAHRAPDFDECWTCGQTASIAGAVHRIIPIMLWDTGTPAGNLMHAYKQENSPRFIELREILSRWLRIHLVCLSPEPDARLTLVTHVPSKRASDRPHPLGLVLQHIVAAGGYQSVLIPGPGAGRIGRNRPDPEGFALAPGAWVADQRIVLVDDTFTTGATLQSAAHALTAAGGHVAAAVVVGRKVNWRGHDPAEEVWRRAQRQPFDWDRCCASLPGCVVSTDLGFHLDEPPF